MSLICVSKDSIATDIMVVNSVSSVLVFFSIVIFSKSPQHFLKRSIVCAILSVSDCASLILMGGGDGDRGGRNPGVRLDFLSLSPKSVNCCAKSGGNSLSCFA